MRNLVPNLGQSSTQEAMPSHHMEGEALVAAVVMEDQEGDEVEEGVRGMRLVRRMRLGIVVGEEGEECVCYF